MNKLKCLLFGHKNLVSTCPFTGITQSICIRCFPHGKDRGQSFK
jgi:hypothetical protein